MSIVNIFGQLAADQIRAHKHAALVILILLAGIGLLIWQNETFKHETREREIRQELLAVQREKRHTDRELEFQKRLDDCNEGFAERLDKMLELLKK